MRITRTLVLRIITRIVVGLMARETGGKVGESCKNAGRAKVDSWYSLDGVRGRDKGRSSGDEMLKRVEGAARDFWGALLY